MSSKFVEAYAKLFVNNAWVRYAMLFACFLFLGMVSRYVFSSSWMPSFIETWRRFIGAVLGVASIFGRLGWKIQSWSGKTPKEKLDKWLFRVFSGISFFLLI